jgi:hypothetical protein
MRMLLVLPVLIPLAGAIASLLSWSEMRLQRRLVVPARHCN